jgi:hypothetical protein
MDDPDIIADIYELAAAAAKIQVKPSHFFRDRAATAASPHPVSQPA